MTALTWLASVRRPDLLLLGAALVLCGAGVMAVAL